MEGDLVKLQDYILSVDAGKQSVSLLSIINFVKILLTFLYIAGHVYYSPLNAKEQVVLPRTFTFIGQKFTVDSWVTSNVSYDRVLDEVWLK